jgi:hypothetical protein
MRRSAASRSLTFSKTTHVLGDRTITKPADRSDVRKTLPWRQLLVKFRRLNDRANAFESSFGMANDVFAIEIRFAAPQKVGQDLECSRLAGTIRTEVADALARFDCQAKVIKRNLSAVIL